MNENISTEELAAALRIQPQTIRAGLCRNKGKHYMGLKPIKLPNRRLLWPADAVERIIALDMKQSAPADSLRIPDGP